MKISIKTVVFTVGLALISLYVTSCSSAIAETEQTTYSEESSRGLHLGGKGTAHEFSEISHEHHHGHHNKALDK